MTTRRALLFSAIFVLAAAWAPALPETKPLQVTYYFLPG